MERVHEQIQNQPAAARQPDLPHRRRHRDHADLPRRRRAAATSRPFDLLQDPTTGIETLRATTRAISSIAHAPTALGLRAGEPHLARQPRLGRASSAIRARRSPRVNRDGHRADAGPARRVTRRRSAPMVVSGCIGPRGDGYEPGSVMSADEAAGLSRRADRGRSPRPRPTWSRAFTMTYADEAIGIARAAQARGHAGGDLVHRGDRRPAADRPERWARRSPRSTPRPAARPPTT